VVLNEPLKLTDPTTTNDYDLWKKINKMGTSTVAAMGAITPEELEEYRTFTLAEVD
jgi:hypothetical protein